MSPRRIASVLAAAVPVLGTALVAVGAGQAPAAAQSVPAHSGVTETTTTVEYGPFTIPAAPHDGEGGHHGGSELSSIKWNVEKPCEDCYITGFAPTLLYQDGTQANVNTGAMLHHFVMFNSTERDVVCNGSQRVLASGNERVASHFPDGYGLHVADGERWNLNYDLMNHSHEDRTVTISVTFTHVPASADLEPLTPLWLDVGGCYSSAYDVPEGTSEESDLWRSTVTGDLVHMRGHLHHAGHSLWTVNLSDRGRTLCHITAEEGGTPEFIDLNGHGEISDMPPCSGGLGRIERGDLLRTTARYAVPGHTHEGVMGIMVGWIAED